MSDLSSDQNAYENAFAKIQRNTARINQLCKELDTMKNAIGKPSYNASTRSLLSNKEKEATKLIKETVDQINRLSSNLIPNNSLKTRFETLQSTFQRAFDRLRCVTTSIQMRCKEEQRKIAQESSNVVASDSDQQVLVIQQQQAQELSMQLDEEAEMRRLEEDIVQLNSLYQQMATMVHSQDQMVDDIEANIDTAYEEVASGNDQLRTAVRHRNASRKRCCICSIVLAFVLLIIAIILIVKFVPSHSRKDRFVQ